VRAGSGTTPHANEFWWDFSEVVESQAIFTYRHPTKYPLNSSMYVTHWSYMQKCEINDLFYMN